MTGVLRVPVPRGTAHAEWFPDTDPDSGTAVFTARPARAAWAAGQDLLAALGKRDDVAGAGRNHDEDMGVLHAWLAAHRVRLVLVRHADFFGPQVLDALTLLCAAAGADLGLVHDDGSGQHVVDRVERHGGQTAAWDTLAKRLNLSPQSAVPQAPEFPVYLPRVAFPLFRAACRDLLDPAEHAVVDTRYVDAFRAWRDAAPVTAQHAHDVLTGMLGDCSGRPEAVVVLRAAQAAALVLGHHLKVDLRTLLIEVDGGQHRRMSPAELRALRAYRQPWRAVAVALRDADLPNTAVTALTVDQVDRDGDLARSGHEPLAAEARTYLRAQRTWRLLNGAGPQDPLIEVDGRHLHNGVLRAGADLNLPVTQANTALDQRRSDRWRHTLGLALVPLADTDIPAAFRDEQARLGGKP